MFEKNLNLDSLMSTLLAKARDYNTSVRELQLRAMWGGVHALFTGMSADNDIVELENCIHTTL